MAIICIFGHMKTVNIRQQLQIWNPDFIGQGFAYTTIDQAIDYEGAVVCTLLRKPASAASRKAVLYVHGFNDYFFHTELSVQFHDAGFHFYALDLRKSGRSWRLHQKFNNVRDVKEYFEDIEAALKRISDEGSNSIVLYGHSMGGLVASLFMAQSSNPHIRALILNSPFFEMNKDRLTREWVVPLVARLGRYFPNQLVPGGFSPFYGPSLHRTAYGEWDYKLEWKPHIAPLVNMGWIRAIYLAQQAIWKGIRLNVPVLVLHSEKSVYGRRWKVDFKKGDAILNVKSIMRHSKKLDADRKVVVLTNAVHDVMLSAPEVRQKAYTAVFDWLRSCEI